MVELKTDRSRSVAVKNSLLMMEDFIETVEWFFGIIQVHHARDQFAPLHIPTPFSLIQGITFAHPLHDL